MTLREKLGSARVGDATSKRPLPGRPTICGRASVLDRYDIHETTPVTRAEFHLAVGQGKQRVIAATADVVSWMKVSAALTPTIVPALMAVPSKTFTPSAGRLSHGRFGWNPHPWSLT